MSRSKIEDPLDYHITRTYSIPIRLHHAIVAASQSTGRPQSELVREFIETGLRNLTKGRVR